MLPRPLRAATAAALFLAVASPAAAQQVRYYHLDALGSVRALSNGSGVVVERHDYLPFGEECTTGTCLSNPGLNAGGPLKFTGKERDAETGNDYFGARYGRAALGRFTSIDPVYTWRENLTDPLRWNRYAYVRNNPLRYVDPDGRKVRVAQEGNSVTITVPVTMVHVSEGPSGRVETPASPAQQAWFKSTTERAWSGKFEGYDVKTVVVDGDDNTIYFVSGSAEVRAGAPDGSSAYDAITWGTPALNRGEAVRPASESSTLAHEVGHLMYLRDQYDKVKGSPNYGKPLPGETDIMSRVGGPIEGRTIKRVLDGYKVRPTE